LAILSPSDGTFSGNDTDVSLRSQAVIFQEGELDIFAAGGVLSVGTWIPSVFSSDPQTDNTYFKGCVDEFRVYERDTEFTAATYIQNYGLNVQPGEEGLTHLWKFEDKDLSQALDTAARVVTPLLPAVNFTLQLYPWPSPSFKPSTAFLYELQVGDDSLDTIQVVSVAQEQLAEQTCSVFIRGISPCAVLGQAQSDFYYLACISDVTTQGLAGAMSSTLAFADFCVSKLGLTRSPLQPFCNERVFNVSGSYYTIIYT
jgi:hypothetical protein